MNAILITIITLAAIFIYVVCKMIQAAKFVRKEQKEYFKKLLPALTLCLFLFSCSPAKHYQKIHGLTKSGNIDADIKTKLGDTVTLKNIAGVYVLRNDTLIRIK